MEWAENFEHEVKATEVELHYSEAVGRATIHKAGCKHAADSKRPFDLAGVGADDFFHVAPCARKA